MVGGSLGDSGRAGTRAACLAGGCRRAVGPRQVYRFDPGGLGPRRQLGGTPGLLTLPVPAGASSAIREQPSPELVPPVLWAELVKHNLYGLGQPSSPPAR